MKNLKDEIKELGLIDLLNLYVEAKAGRYIDITDALPVEILDSIQELDEELKNIIDE